MIAVLTKGHDFFYEIHDIVRLFFWNKKIVRTDEEIAAEDGDILIISTLYGDHDGCGVRTRIKTGNADITKELPVRISAMRISAKENSVPGRETEEETVLGEKERHELKKILKSEVKRCLYTALETFTQRSMPWGVLTGVRPSKIVHELMDEGKDKESILRILREYYRISAGKADLLYTVAVNERDILDRTERNTVSMYIGIPFCTSRCLYCSFTSNLISRYGHFVERYMESLKKEMTGTLEILAEKGFRVSTVYIGGGTPTAISEQHLDELLNFIGGCINTKELEEYTLEAGRPDTITREKLEIIRKNNVNRISINPQTMNDKTLELIGRGHRSADIVRAFHDARSAGFENINMDVIIGLPGENLKIFKDTLDKLGELDPESLTVHTMSVKRKSVLMNEWDKYRTVIPEEAEEMVEAAAEHARSMGMHPYYLYRQKNILGNLENVGYCKPGFEGIYNVQIMAERQTIIALGAGAVTKAFFPDENRIERAFNVKDLEEYMQRIDEMIERKRNLLLGYKGAGTEDFKDMEVY